MMPKPAAVTLLPDPAPDDLATHVSELHGTDPGSNIVAIAHAHMLAHVRGDRSTSDPPALPLPLSGGAAPGQRGGRPVKTPATRKGSAVATRTISGANYSLDGNTIRFFGAKGTVFGNGNWGVNAFGASIDIEVDPDSIMPRVLGCLQGDDNAGNGLRAAQIHLGPRQAVVFYLEGGMTSGQLAQAAEGPGFVDIPGVMVDGRMFTVRVLAEPEHEVATADADGNLLP
jgi:hypothetical protein